MHLTFPISTSQSTKIFIQKLFIAQKVIQNFYYIINHQTLKFTTCHKSFPK